MKASIREYGAGIGYCAFSTAGSLQPGEAVNKGWSNGPVTRSRNIKRLVDLAGACLGLLALAPILVMTAVTLLVTNGRPVLFRQDRPGLRGEPFSIVKFRTMRPTAAGELAHETDDQRVTRIGRFLRTTSIDELPELWNVLRGQMSLVGPRPLLAEYLESYTPDEHRRHDMRPGITSLAAVNGRHSLHFRERVALDVWYVDHWTLRLDLRIIAMTVWQVVHRRDVQATQSPGEIGFPFRSKAVETPEARPDSDGSAVKRSR